MQRALLCAGMQIFLNETSLAPAALILFSMQKIETKFKESSVRDYEPANLSNSGMRMNEFGLLNNVLAPFWIKFMSYPAITSWLRYGAKENFRRVGGYLKSGFYRYFPYTA